MPETYRTAICSQNIVNIKFKQIHLTVSYSLNRLPGSRRPLYRFVERRSTLSWIGRFTPFPSNLNKHRSFFFYFIYLNTLQVGDPGTIVFFSPLFFLERTILGVGSTSRSPYVLIYTSIITYKSKSDLLIQ
jgi:hypothetical protein